MPQCSVADGDCADAEKEPHKLQVIRQHPQFRPLVNLEARRRRLVQMPGGRDKLAQNADECFRAEARILRDTGCTFSELTSAVLPMVGD